MEDSLSPFMHNAAFKAEKIDAEYKLFDIDPEDTEALSNFCYETGVNNISGFSVTMPFKEKIMNYLDYYDPLAKIVGSVNTVMSEDSNLNGYNTDSTGAIQALKEKTGIKGKKILVMGAGGSARAIIYGLKEFGADIHIFNRTIKKAEILADEFNLETIDFRYISNAKFDIVINCTPVGNAPNTTESLLHANNLNGVKVVMDIITNPLETQLIKEAKKAGCEVITGERMLLHQACGQFEIWQGKTAPIDVMETALYSAIKRLKD